MMFRTTTTLGPNHPLNRASEARGVSWVKTNMADDLFDRNPPSQEINSFLRRNMHDYLSKTESSATMHSISRFYHEVETAIGMLEQKYVGQSRNKEIQQLVGTQRMVINALKKIHTKIVSRLRSTPKLSNPWKGEFSLDIPREVFDVILKHIVQRNSYGHECRESTAVVNVEVTRINKAVFIFHKMNIEGELIAKDDLLKKKPTKNNERCEVIVDNSKPLKLRYNKHSEVLSVNFHYGYWNEHGVPQH